MTNYDLIVERLRRIADDLLQAGRAVDLQMQAQAIKDIAAEIERDQRPVGRPGIQGHGTD